MDKRPWEVTPKKLPKHPSKKAWWKLRSVRNWFYDKWMRWRGYKPYTFDFTQNRYNYDKDEDLLLPETEPVHELVGYKKKKIAKPWWRQGDHHDSVELNAGKQEALNALRKGDVDNECIIRRTL